MARALAQEDLILNHLKTGRAITPIYALNMYGCFRLAARIEELRKDGHNIVTEIIKKNGKKWASYSIPMPTQLEMFAA